MRKPDYPMWENVFLDTSILFAYMRAVRTDNTDPRSEFVKTLIDDLTSTKTTGKKTRNFYMSAITIAEMYNKSDNTKKAEKIVKHLDTKNMTFVGFDTDIAEFMTNNYHTVLAKDKLNAVAREFSWPEHDLVMAREWITKDLMIISSAHYLDCDTVLTLDVKTFKPLAEKVDYNCCLALQENFLFAGDIFGEEHRKIVNYKY
jgi:hypothetical protein